MHVVGFYGWCMAASTMRGSLPTAPPPCAPPPQVMRFHTLPTVVTTAAIPVGRTNMATVIPNEVIVVSTTCR